MAGPPAGVKPASLFRQMLSRGRLPHATVPFPRYNDLGEPICQVYLRPLTQREMDACRANAAAYVAKMTADSRDAKWRPEDLEDNAVAAEVLAIACRKDEDPELAPLFDGGVIDTRECTTEELAMLFAAYNAVREKSYPSLSEMTDMDMWAWVRALEEGAENFPFSRVSRAKLEAFSLWAAKSLVILSRLVSGMTSSSSPPSPSEDSPSES